MDGGFGSARVLAGDRSRLLTPGLSSVYNTGILRKRLRKFLRDHRNLIESGGWHG